MVQDLPDDVWSHLVETPYLGHRTLRKLSFASKRIRRLVAPVLFRCLYIHLSCCNLYESNVNLVELIQVNMRVRFLLNSGLLQHTRVFTLWGNPYTQASIAKDLALHTDSDDSSSRVDAGNLLAVIHDVLFSLIFRMSGLRELHINHLVMTPLCYAAISSRPLLSKLILRQRYLPDITHVTPAPPNALRLREFDYHCDVWGFDNPPPDLFVADILDHCILDLEKLNMSSIQLSLVAARIPLHHTLSLRSLTTSLRYPLDVSLAVAELITVLHACPQLQDIFFSEEQFPDVELTHDLLPLSLPNLSTITGPLGLLQLVTGGTNIVSEVTINETFYIQKQPLTQVIRSSPTHLRDLYMHKVVVSRTAVHELLTFIQSLAVFRNLERVTIVYEIVKSWAGHLPWKSRVSAQDSHSTIKELLKELVCLRSLDIHYDSDSHWPDPDSDHSVGGYDIGCPISRQGDPFRRGHPSLERIHVDFLCGKWTWDYWGGWVGGEQRYHREDTQNLIQALDEACA